MGRAPGPVSACGAGLIERGTGLLEEKQGREESTGEKQVGALLLEEDTEVLEMSGEGQRRPCRVWITSEGAEGSRVVLSWGKGGSGERHYHCL